MNLEMAKCEHGCSLYLHICFPGGSEVKAYACNAGDPGLIPGWGRSPGEGNGNPLQYSCLGNPMDLRSLVGYSPQGRKESDTTERLHFHLFLGKYLILLMIISMLCYERPDSF